MARASVVRAVCSFAALFNLANTPITTNASPDVLLLVSRLNLFFGGLHAAAWFKYVAAHARRDLARWEWLWVSGGILLSFLALLPGLVVQHILVPRPVP